MTSRCAVHPRGEPGFFLKARCFSAVREAFFQHPPKMQEWVLSEASTQML